MGSQAPTDPLAKLLHDLKVTHNSLKKTLTGLQARVVYLEVNLLLDISKDSDGFWQVSLTGNFLQSIAVKVKSRKGGRSEIRNLFLDAMRQYIDEQRKMTMKAVNQIETMSTFMQDMVDEQVLYI